MKILIIHHSDSWGGAGVSLLQCCKMLQDDYDVTVCVPHINSIVAENLRKYTRVSLRSFEANVGMISAYNGGPSLYTRTFFRNLVRIPRCAKTALDIMQEGFDLVLLNSMTLACYAPYIRRTQTPCVCYVRETKPARHLGYCLITRLINKYCSGVLFISNHDHKTMGLKLTNQQVVKNCVDERFFKRLPRNESCSRLGLNENKFNVLFVGGNSELKGYSVLMKAIEIFFHDHPEESSRVQFVIAGKVPQEQQAHNNSISYVGNITETQYLFSACDVLLFPSTAGHQARPIFEAGACQIPAIVSDFPEVAEEIQEGYNGLLFPSGNSQALADKIWTLYSDDTLRTKSGQNNLSQFEQEHSFAVMKRRFVDFCTRIISQN